MSKYVLDRADWPQGAKRPALSMGWTTPIATRSTGRCPAGSSPGPEKPVTNDSSSRRRPRPPGGGRVTMTRLSRVTPRVEAPPGSASSVSSGQHGLRLRHGRPWLGLRVGLTVSLTVDLTVDVDPRQPTLEPGREPPGEVTKQAHRRGDENHPDQRDVEEHRRGQTDPEHLGRDVHV